MDTRIQRSSGNDVAEDCLEPPGHNEADPSTVYLECHLRDGCFVLRGQEESLASTGAPAKSSPNEANGKDLEAQAEKAAGGCQGEGFERHK